MDFLFSPDIFIACTFLIVNSWCNVTSHVVFNVLWQGQASKLTIICSLLICLLLFVCSLGFSPVKATVKEIHQLYCSCYSLKWNNTRWTRQEFTRYWNQSDSHSMPRTRNRALNDKWHPGMNKNFSSFAFGVVNTQYYCPVVLLWVGSEQQDREGVWVSVGKSSVDTTVYVGRQKA